MAAKPEAKVKLKGRRICSEVGMYHHANQMGAYGKAGVFDDDGCLNSVYIGIEYKATDKHKLSALQVKNARNAMNAGAVVLVVHEQNIDQLKGALQDLAQAESWTDLPFIMEQLQNGPLGFREPCKVSK